MQSFHLILRLSFAIAFGAQAELFGWDLFSSNALGPDESDQGKSFDISQPFDTSSNLDIDVGGSFEFGNNDLTLFANVPDDTCLSFSSPLIGKARRRRNGHPACLPIEEIPDLSGTSVEGLARPGEFEQNYCSKGGLLQEIAFLVCSSGRARDVMPSSLGGFTLYHSIRRTLKADI